jgi:hypothetical protein
MTTPRPHVLVNVATRDDRARSGPLAWGQYLYWISTVHLGEDDAALNSAVAVPLGKVDLERVLRSIRHLVGGFDILRTTFVEQDGGVRQVVAPSGRLTVELLDAGPDEVDARSGEMAERLRIRRFRFAEEWPIRFGVVMTAGLPVVLVVVIARVALDFGGVKLVADEMTRLLEGGEAQPPPSFEPLDLAHLEQSAEYRAISARAIAYGRKVFSTAPPTLFDFPTAAPVSPRFLRFTLHSRALGPAVEHVAAVRKVSTSAVLLAAVTTALGRYTDHDTVVLSSVAGNRSGDPHRNLVSTVSMFAFLAIPVRGPSFYATITQAFMSSVEGYMNSYYAMDAMHAAVEDLQLSIGARIDRHAYFNDARLKPPPQPRVLDPDTISTLRASGEVLQEVGPANQDLKFQLFVSDDATDGINLSLVADSMYLPESAVRGILTGIERLLVAAASRDLTLEQVHALMPMTPVVRPIEDGWVPCRQGWLNLPAVNALWRETIGDAGLVTVRSDPAAGHRIVGYFTGDRNIAQLHRTMVAAAVDRVDVRTPTWYVQCANAPRDGASADAWADQPVVHASDGR